MSIDAVRKLTYGCGMIKKLHQRETVEKSIARLNGLPEKPKNALTAHEIVTMMRDTIAALRGRGYSFDDIEKNLAEDGINIKKSTMMSALRTRKKPSSRQKKENSK
jgi:hypothetical protein